jgi:hypothetical protein
MRCSPGRFQEECGAAEYGADRTMGSFKYIGEVGVPDGKLMPEKKHAHRNEGETLFNPTRYLTIL